MDLIALQRADVIPQEDMKPHYPSLHLNLGKSYERLEDVNAAYKHSQLHLVFAWRWLWKNDPLRD